MCMHVYIYICMYFYTYICIYIWMCMCVCVYVYEYMYIYLCICMCIYICICLYIACMCSLFHLTLGNEDGGVQPVWEGLSLTEGKIGVLSVSSLFLTRVGVYVCVCVCMHTHTHTLHEWGTWMWTQESGWDTWRARRIRWTKSRYTYIRICVQSTHVYIYAKRRDEILD